MKQTLSANRRPPGNPPASPVSAHLPVSVKLLCAFSSGSPYFRL